MKSFRFEPGPIHVIRLERGEDIVDAMTAYADEHHIRTAWFTHLGAVSAASLRYYDQTKLVYRDFTVDRHLESALRCRQRVTSRWRPIRPHPCRLRR